MSSLNRERSGGMFGIRVYYCGMYVHRRRKQRRRRISRPMGTVFGERDLGIRGGTVYIPTGTTSVIWALCSAKGFSSNPDLGVQSVGDPWSVCSVRHPTVIGGNPCSTY